MMKTQRVLAIFVVFGLLVLSLSACQLGPVEEEFDLEQAVSIALTETLAALEAAQPTETAEVPTPTPEVETGPGELGPLGDCADLKAAIEPALGVAIASENVPIEMSWSGQTGVACQLTGLGDGNDFENIFTASDALKALLRERGWAEQGMMLPCLGHGGAGPGADQACFVKEDQLCELMVTVEPTDMALCDDIEGPIGECLAALAPDQLSYTVTLTCAQGLDTTDMPEAAEEPPAEPTRIEFAEGEESISLTDTLDPEQTDRYVLSAAAGQEMSVDLESPGIVALTIVGADGGVLKSELEGGNQWSDVLAESGDYYLDVKSLDESSVEYTLEVVIPPLAQTSEKTGISGGIAYPGETIPPLHIVVYDQDSYSWYWIGAAENSSAYTFTNLPPGTYTVVAYTESELVGGYVSGGGAALAPVTVKSGEITTGIDITAWFQPGGASFPSDPTGW
jgi:hypothetical protein